MSSANRRVVGHAAEGLDDHALDAHAGDRQQLRGQVGTHRALLRPLAEPRGEQLALLGSDPDRQHALTAALCEKHEPHPLARRARGRLAGIVIRALDDHVLDVDLDHSHRLQGVDELLDRRLGLTLERIEKLVQALTEGVALLQLALHLIEMPANRLDQADVVVEQRRDLLQA